MCVLISHNNKVGIFMRCLCPFFSYHHCVYSAASTQTLSFSLPFFSYCWFRTQTALLFIIFHIFFSIAILSHMVLVLYYVQISCVVVPFVCVLKNYTRFCGLRGIL